MREWTEWHDRYADRIELVPGVDCWLWTGCVGARGHGRLTFRQRHHYAHRAAFVAAKGEIPEDRIVRHLCGCSACVRPSHLATGTAADNSKDTATMFCGTGRLSKADVLAIRAEYAAGVPLAEIAAKYPVALGTVYPIVSGYAYRHVEGAIPGGLRSPRKLDRQKAAEIRSRANAGERHNDLAKEFGVKANLISRISTGVRWRDA